MTYLGAVLLVSVFIALFKLFRLIDVASGAVACSKESVATVLDNSLGDEEKELVLRSASKKLFVFFLKLTVGGALSLFIPVCIIAGMDLLGILSFDEVISFTLSWEFILITTVIMIFFFVVLRKSKDNQDYEIRYSFFDRALHYIAFKAITPQLALADVEDSFFGKQLEGIETNSPVFITGLPRGGTTLVLDMCFRLNEFSSHRYRDMPFLLVPMFWGRFSKKFQQADEKRERAHGDGMMVSVDSPEALEEIVWKPFWREQYAKDRILPWAGPLNNMFDDFFDNHMKKVIAIKQAETGEMCRYVSKNNLNISRINYLKKAYPNSTIIVPYMHPVTQGNSLLEQHKNFLSIHKTDRFASSYMEGVGHYDFGNNIRPIDFGDWLDSREFKDFNDINFWIEYWVVAYGYLLEIVGDNVYLHSHEALCQDTKNVLSKLSDILNVTDHKEFMKNEEMIWKTPPPSISSDNIDRGLLKRAELLYQKMRENSLA